MNPKIPIKSNLMYKILFIWRPSNFGASGRGLSGPALGTALVFLSAILQLIRIIAKLNWSLF
jgi:hypothetical protein